MEDLQELIKNCIRNDRLSQKKLYMKFYPALFLLCKRFFADDHEALEALNDGMLKVYKKIGLYDPQKGEFFNWVYTIIRHTVLDKIRLNRQPPVTELHDDYSLVLTDNIFQSLDHKDLYQLLDKLSPRTRVVCSLFYLEGLTIKDISHDLQMSTGTVKWHLSEARSRLRPVMKKYFS